VANLYLNESLPEAAFDAGALITVEGEEARHAVRVSRLRRGEEISVGNGSGVIGHGTVEAIEKQHFAVRLDSVTKVSQPRIRLTLVQALAKGDRAERAVEQATEFGVDRILPWEASRSVSRWSGAGGEKAVRGRAKWQRIAREAAKQSIRAWIPEVGSLIDTSSLCRSVHDEGCELIVLHPAGTQRLSEWRNEQPEGASSTEERRELRIVVGPEGGFTDDELVMLSDAGAREMRLGDAVLRTSSAGPAGLAILNVATGRW